MSGPVASADVPAEAQRAAPEACVLEITQSRESRVGAIKVRRALPQRGRRTVGPWCFVDHMGPALVSAPRGMDVAPHPHIGLQTVTWLLEGEALHRDSLGNEQVIVPGQLNLMTAGWGVAHSEEGTGSDSGNLHGAQLWIAQPSATRDGPAAFEHHSELRRRSPPRRADHRAGTSRLPRHRPHRDLRGSQRADPGPAGGWRSLRRRGAHVVEFRRPGPCRDHRGTQRLDRRRRPLRTRRLAPSPHRGGATTVAALTPRGAGPSPRDGHSSRDVFAGSVPARP